MGIGKRFVNKILNNNGGIALLLVVIGIPGLIMAQSSGLTSFEGSLNSSVSTIFGYVRIAVTVGMLIYTIWPFYHALVGEGDKSRYWWQIIGIACFLIILNVFPAVFNGIFGTNVNVTSP
jgi:hypothetical protein